MRKAACFTLFLVGCGGPSEGEPMGQGGAQAGGGQVGQSGSATAGQGGSATAGQSGSATAGQGGSATAGQAGASSGSSGASGGGGAATCAERWSQYEPLAKAARVCDPTAATPQCTSDVVVLDACGCSVPANKATPEYAQARRLLVKYAEDCEFPEQCLKCLATLGARCADDGTGISQCVYE